MRYLLEPTPEIKNDIENILSKLSMKKKQYCVIHIRSGDKYLINNSNIDISYYNKIIKEFKFMNRNHVYLLLSDNNKLKNILMKKFPFLKMIVNEITHFGEGVELQENSVKNTLIDFYLMSHAKFIISFSSYEHGSGFSKWCSETYNIPYKIKIIT